MRYLFLILIVKLLFVINITPIYGQTMVSGEVKGIWEASGNPYYVTGDVQISDGDSLIIKEGTEINFIGAYAFKVYGLLKAIGTEENKIIFHGDGGAGSWKDIYFGKTATKGSILNYCIIKDGGYEFDTNIMIKNNSNFITINNCEISNSLGNGIQIYSKLKVGTWVNNKTETCNGKIINNTIKQNQKNGIFIYAYYMDTGDGAHNNKSIANPIIEKNVIYENALHGIACESFSDGGSNYGSDSDIIVKCLPKIQKNTIVNNAQNCINCERTSQGFYYGTNIIRTNPFISTNIIYKNGSYGLDAKNHVDTDSVKHNDFWQNQLSDLNGIGGGLGDIIRTNLNGDSCDANANIFFDPEFVDELNNNFHLSENSKCIDAGDLNLEFDPDGSIPDIGAYFYNQKTNNPPFVSKFIADTTFAEDSGSHLISSDLNEVFSDPDGDALTFSASSNNPDILPSVKNDSLFVESSADYFGNSSVIVTATDPGGLSANDTFLVEITPVNDAPGLFELLSPADKDTVDTLGAPIQFVWTQAQNVDQDTIWYDLKIFNAAFDTLVGDLTDTTFTFHGKGILQYNDSYQWTVTARDRFVSTPADTFLFYTPSPPTAIQPSAGSVPQAFALQQNYPNPFNPTTTIKYALPKAANVKLEVFNVLGQRVATLVDARQPAGYHQVVFNGAGLPSGVYYYRLSTDAGFSQAKKMILFK
ncbi:T9SS type A sorting domain-containing protein [Calditrichota bacterium GD2]